MNERAQLAHRHAPGIVEPDTVSPSRPRQLRRWRRDLAALLVGGTLFGLVFAIGCTVAASWDDAFCSGEWRPFLGSGRQAFAIYGCLARDAGPLIKIKKALRIYDPKWKTVIR